MISGDLPDCGKGGHPFFEVCVYCRNAAASAQHLVVESSIPAAAAVMAAPLETMSCVVAADQQY